jgi:hypothetical protein
MSKQMTEQEKLFKAMEVSKRVQQKESMIEAKEVTRKQILEQKSEMVHRKMMSKQMTEQEKLFKAMEVSKRVQQKESMIEAKEMTRKQLLEERQMQIKRKMDAKELEKQMAKVDGRFARFDMRMLSIMFLGMQMQRTFGGMMKGMVKTFMDAEQNTSGLNQAFTRLWASVEFLKFSLIDALDQDWFIGFIDGVISAIDWISQLPEEVRASISSITAMLAVTGGVATIGVLLRGAWQSLFGVGGYLVSDVDDGMKAIHAKTIGTNGVLTALKNFVITGFAIKMIFDFAKYGEGEMTFRQLIDNIGTDLAMIGLASGNPWVIAAGVTLKLLPLGEQLQSTGTTMVNKGIERIKKALSDNPESIMDVLGDWGLLLGGGTQFLAGGFITGTGGILEGVDKLLGLTENAEEKVQPFENSMLALKEKTESANTQLDGFITKNNTWQTNVPSYIDYLEKKKKATDELATSISKIPTQVDTVVNVRTNYVGGNNRYQSSVFGD